MLVTALVSSVQFNSVSNRSCPLCPPPSFLSCRVGALPPEWSQMPALASLDLSHNKLAGPLPPEWGQLSVLTKLRLGRNIKLSSAVPPEWAELQARAQLDIGDQAHVLNRATSGGLVVQPDVVAL